MYVYIFYIYIVVSDEGYSKDDSKDDSWVQAT